MARVFAVLAALSGLGFCATAVLSVNASDRGDIGTAIDLGMVAVVCIGLAMALIHLSVESDR